MNRPELEHGDAPDTVSVLSRIPDERESDAILLLNSQGRIIGSNIDARSITGYAEDEIYSIDLSMLFGREFSLARVQRYGSRLDKSFPIEVETWLQPKEADLIPVTVRASRLVYENRQQAYVLTISKSRFSGIGDLMECGASVCLVKEEYQDNLELVAHDTKGPLVTIRGYLRLLQKHDLLKKKPQIETLIGGALGATDRLEEIVKMIVPKGADQDANAKRYVFLSDLAKRAAYGLAQDLSVNKAVLAIENLGVAYANPIEITEVFQNLIENAIRYGHHPSEPSRIRIVSVPSEDNEVVKIMVSDQGPGIVLKDQLKIFEKFQRSNTKYGGAEGLGLSICKKFIVNNGGSIWVESDEGSGSKFIFTLPRRKLLSRTQ